MGMAVEEDRGLFAGMHAGFFVPDVKSFDNYKCKTPEVPEIFKSAEAMIPMVTLMFKNATGQKELPPIYGKLQELFVGAEQILFTFVSGYEGSQFCKGLILSYHAKTLAMKAYQEFPNLKEMMPAFPFHSPMAALQ